MTAVNPATSAAADSSPIAKEPSMEEILASIRRIIADDQSLPSIMGLRGAVEDESASQPVPVEPQRETPAPVHRLHPEPVPPKPVTEVYMAPAALYGQAAASSAADEPNGLGKVEPPNPSLVHPPQIAPVDAPPVTVGGYAPPQAFAADVGAPPSPVPEERVTQRPTIAPAPEMPMAHGRIAAPQFAGPAGPEAIEEEPMPSPLVLDVMRQDLEAERVRSAAPVKDAAKADDASIRGVAETPPETATSLFSSETGQSVSSAFNVLAATRLADNSDELMSLAREMIRPLLRAWIDDNLPSMVERLVRAEIERVSRGGR